METQQQTTDLAVLNRYGALAITVSDPRLPPIASRLGFKSSERLLLQIQEYIPVALEQQIFVALAADGYGLRPMKFAEVLVAHRGNNPLTISAFERKEVSPNVFFSSIDALQDFVDTIIAMVAETELADCKVSTRSAIVLAKTYGENAEKVVDGILDNTGHIADAMGLNSRRYLKMNPVNLALNFLARQIIPACEHVGVPAPLRMLDFFEDDGYARAREHCMKDGQMMNVFPESSEGVLDGSR